MRVGSYILVILGVLLLANAGYDEFRGSTTKPWTIMGRRFRNDAYLYRLHVLKENNPELFRKFMATHWIYASFIAVGGVILLLWSKNREDFNT
jgi:hypothetical protein